LYALPKRIARKPIESEHERIVLEKKSFAPWCIRNGFFFLYHHCKYKSRTFLLPKEQEGQKRIAKVMRKISLIDQQDSDSLFIYTVRVLLDEQKLTAQAQPWELKSSHGFLIHDYNQPSTKIFLPQKSLNVTCFANGIYINNKRSSAKRILINPAQGFLEFNGYHYEGAFMIALEEENSYLMSQLDIEDYIYSVLRWESWPGWPIEVNKAFAIACRTYLIAKVLDATKRQKIYHIKNTNIHQTYNGVHEFVNLKHAIEETRGLILSYKLKPIDAMFDSCCGGVIPAKLAGVNFKKAPYLARNYPCDFCKTCKIYAWKLEYSKDDLKELMCQAGHQVDDIVDIRVIQKDKAGVPRHILVQDRHKSHTFTSKQFYSLISKIKSFCYTIEKNGDKICFNGKGYGHHLGICQWGARRMIDAGYKYRSILYFYYPGATLMALKNAVS
jgi:stage II sporulation protein D